MGKWSVLVPAAAAPVRTDSRTDAPDAELVTELRARIDSLERRLDAVQAERARLLALLERRRWPGLWPALRRFWSGEQR